MIDFQERRFSFIDLKFHNYTMDEMLEQLIRLIIRREPCMVATITAELIVRASQDSVLRNIYNQADLLTIDSFVVYYAARLLRKPAAMPVHATRLALRFLPVMNDKFYSLYILGAKDDVVRRAVENINFQYPKINIVGFHHGYFDFADDRSVVEDIKIKRPDVLFVAMSSPLKENFISKNLKEMGVPVCIAVGGGVDIMAGKFKLAPLWVSVVGLEWFYRLLQEPRRMWRRYIVTNTKFLCLFMREIFKKGGDDGNS